MPASEQSSSLTTYLRGELQSPLLFAGEPGYDRARMMWNADIDRAPSAIVACRDTHEVAAALLACRARGLRVTVRGGGHNIAGSAVQDGAVMLDLSAMRSVQFDHDAKTVTVAGGGTWGDVDRLAADYGVAVPAGVVSHTGVAGLTLGGGEGYLSRLHGATVDHLVQTEVVLADGRVVTTSPDRHADLFWALRGAGHNYCIVTAFTFSYVAIPTYANVRQAIFRASDRRAVLEKFGSWAVAAPDSVSTYVRLLHAPPYWSQVPTAHRGEPVAAVATVYYGDPRQEERLTREMFAEGAPLWSATATVPHARLQHACDDEFRSGLGHYWKHAFIASVDATLIDLALTWCDRYPGEPVNARAGIAPQLACPFEIHAGGGELARMPGDATSMPDRTVLYSATVGADWEPAVDAGGLVAWAKGFSDELSPHQAGTYINFASTAGDARVAQEVYGANYGRLVAVKRAYDPENVFRAGLVDLSGSDPERDRP